MDELEAILARKFSITPAAAAFLKAFAQHVPLVDPEPLSKPVCRDADDDLVLATAISAKATTIVTGDDDLLVLRRYLGVEICTPRRFLERLDAQAQ